MNQRCRILSMIAIILLVSVSCKKSRGVTEEPEVKGRFSFGVTMPAAWRWEESSTRSQTLLRHLVAEVWNGNMRVARQEWEAEISDSELLLEMKEALPPATYKVILWSDVRPEGGKGSYDTSSLLRIKAESEAGLETDTRDCASATALITTRGENLTTMYLSLDRPVGRWRMICDNERELLSLLTTLAPKGAPYKVQLTYDSPVISVYDAGNRLATSLKDNVTLSAIFEPLDMPGVQSAFLSDWLLLESDGETVPASIAFFDRSGNPLINQQGIALNMKPGRAITIRIRVQNTGISTGLTVETEWEGEDIIEL